VTSGAAGIDPGQGVNRNWTMSGGGSLTFGSHATTFTFLAADVDTGASTASFEVSRLTGGTWFVTTAGTRTGTTTQVTGETTFGLYVIGELLDIIYAEYRMEDAAGLGGTISDTSAAGATAPASATPIPSPRRARRRRRWSTSAARCRSRPTRPPRCSTRSIPAST
jgi:hypothetical protein